MLIEGQRYIWKEKKSSLAYGTVLEITDQRIGCCLVPNINNYLEKGRPFWVSWNDVLRGNLVLLPNQKKPNV
jgi:hypothetical protein